MQAIDLRSDTVTKPSKGMLQAMMEAPVGDDVFGEDPTINRLQEIAADMFGMEAALFCPSGTMTNQIAICAHTTPGDEVICHKESHIYKYEGGGIARNAGCSVRLLDGDRGKIKRADVEAWINPDDVHFPITRLLALENTANRGGGSCYDFKEIEALGELAKKHQLGFHLDGARLFNAIVRSSQSARDYGRVFDSISICLSKGLGAPVGSILLGSKDFIRKSHRIRKVFGGGMRQAGILAAAGIYALENNIERLAVDHNNAKALADMFNGQHWVKSILPVETNIVVVQLMEGSQEQEMCQKLKDVGVVGIPFGPGLVRFVTHLDFTESMLQSIPDRLNQL